MNTPDHANVPLPAGLEFYDEDDGQVYVLRDVRVLGPVMASLLDSQAREFAGTYRRRRLHRRDDGWRHLVGP